MSWWTIALIIGGVYLLIGCILATMLMQTPYADNGYLIIMALWPLFLLGILTGG